MKKKLVSKLLSAALAAFLMFTVVPFTALAASTDFTESHVQYTVADKDTSTTATVTGAYGHDITIPSTVTHRFLNHFPWDEHTYSVSAIGDNAFADDSDLETVTFESATPPTVGSGAFSGILGDVVFIVPSGAYSAYKAALPDGAVVREVNCAIMLSDSSLDFGSVVADYTAVDTKTITITNIGSCCVKLKTPHSDNFDIDLSNNWIDVGGTATLTITPHMGLAVGTYTDTVEVKGDRCKLNNNPTFDLSFVVLAHTYIITAEPTPLDFGTITVGYETAPAAQTVTVTNAGNSPVTLEQPEGTDNFAVGDLSTTEALQPGDTATFTVQPVTGLVVGSYADTITVNGSNEASAQVEADFEVVTAPTITAAPNTDFGSLIADYAAAPVAQTVTVTNTSDQAVTLSQPTGTNFVIGALSGTVLQPGETATFTVQPKTGLAVGTYTETVNVSGAGEYGGTATASVSANFVVIAHVYAITATPATLNFGSLTQGYTVPATQLVTVENVGNSPVTLNQPTSTNYTIGALSATVLQPGEKATFTVQPKVGLAHNTYGETIQITGSNSTSASVGVTFTVKVPVDNSPNTGISNFGFVWLALGGVSVAGLVTATVYRRRKHE